MARFVLVLLLVIVGALVMALVFDHRGRRDARIDRLRWAFLHGRPLAGYARGPAVAEIHRGGIRFRVPASWTIEMTENGQSTVAGPPDGARRVQVEVLRLEGASAAGNEAVVEALKTVEAEGERAIERLPNGNVLVKVVQAARADSSPLASYEWRLGRAWAERGVQIAVFRLRLPVETAADIIAQSDLAMLDREVRDARFSEAPPPATA